MVLSWSISTVAFATPSDDLVRAIASAHAPSATEASPKQFLRAYMSILVRARPREVIWYVNAAIKARPDLAAKIVAVTLEVRRLRMKADDKRQNCREIGDIVQAAVMANNETAAAIVKAAVEVEPFARDCIVAAATAAAPDQRLAFLQAAGEAQPASLVRAGLNGSSGLIPTIGTINPADYTSPGNVMSPEQPPQVR